MTKEVDLIQYLPLFVAEYKEIQQIMNTENPEFNLLETEKEKVQNNQYIVSCDESGIARFEQLLNIVPSPDDTLNSRISRCFVRWNSTIPYTYKSLIEKLTAICGEGNFELYPDWESYSIKVIAAMPNCGQVEELNNLLEYIIPANIIVFSENKIRREYGNSVSVGTAIGECIITVIDSELNSRVIYRQSLNGLTATSTHITCVVN